MSMTSAAAIPLPENTCVTRIHTGWSRLIVAAVIVAAGYALSRAVDGHGGSDPSTWMSAPCHPGDAREASSVSTGGASIKRPLPLPSSFGG